MDPDVEPEVDPEVEPDVEFVDVVFVDVELVFAVNTHTYLLRS